MSKKDPASGRAGHGAKGGAAFPPSINLTMNESNHLQNKFYGGQKMAITAMWKSGFESLYHADAQKVAKEIESIGEAVTPQQIVDKAQGKSTELHKCFTWDDTEAAKKYRLDEARHLVCNLVIKREAERPDQPQIRMFYHTTGAGYKKTEYIVRHEDEYLCLLQNALRDLAAFRRKYKMVAELETVFDEIDTLLNRVTGQINKRTYNDNHNISQNDSRI